jgi:hypothetical protein
MPIANNNTGVQEMISNIVLITIAAALSCAVFLVGCAAPQRQNDWIAITREAEKVVNQK